MASPEDQNIDPKKLLKEIEGHANPNEPKEVFRVPQEVFDYIDGLKMGKSDWQKSRIDRLRRDINNGDLESVRNSVHSAVSSGYIKSKEGKNIFDLLDLLDLEEKNKSESQPPEIPQSTEVPAEQIKAQEEVKVIEPEPQTGSEEKNETAEIFETPQEVIDFLNTQIKLTRPGMKALKFDVLDKRSRDVVVARIKKAGVTRILKPEEVDHLLAFLNEEKKEELKPEEPKVETQMDEEPSGQTEVPENFNSGDKITWDGKEETVKSDDGEWVTFESGVMVNLEALRESLKPVDIIANNESEKFKRAGEYVQNLIDQGRIELTDILKYFNTLDQEPDISKIEKVIRNFVWDGDLKIEEGQALFDVLSINGEEFKIRPEDPESQTQSSEVVDTIDVELSNARAEYARLLVEHKNKVREKKGKFSKLMSDLGVETDKQKKLAETQKSQELLEAEKEYIAAKKKKASDLFDRSEERGRYDKKGEWHKAYNFNPELVEQAEKEFESLQNILKNINQKDWEKKNGILDRMTPEEKEARLKQIEKEKNILKKGFDIWRKAPIAVRAFALPVLIGTVMAIAPAGGLAVGASYAGMRAARAIGGMASARGWGKIADKWSAETIRIDRTDAKKEYGKEISKDNYEEREKQLMNYFESEEKKKKRQTLYKAVGMIGAGGVGGLVAGGLEGTLLQHGGAGSFLPHKTIVGDGVKPKVAISPEPLKPSVPTESPKVVTPPVEDNVPPKFPLGPDMGKPSAMPPAEQPASVHVETPPTVTPRPVDLGTEKPPAPPPEVPIKTVGPETPKVAETYDFDKDIYGRDVPVAPKPASSSIPLSEQTEVPEHNAEMPETIDDVQNPEVVPAPEIPVHDNPAYLPESIKGVTAEPISNPEDIPHPNLETTPLPHPGEPLIDHTYNQMPHPPELPDSGAVVPHADVPEMNTPEPIFPPHEVAPTIPSPQIVHSFEQGYHGAKFKVDIADIADKKQILVDGVKIAESVPSPNGNGGVMLQLLDKYQDGSKYAAIRTAYDTAQMDAPILKVFPKSMLGKEILQVPFEDGRIQVFHGIGADKNAVDIYLNGKEIAKGLITDKGPDVEIFKNLKGGLFLADTVYERALKHAMPLVKSFKVLKDVNK